MDKRREKILDLIAFIGTVMVVVGAGFTGSNWQSWTGAIGMGLFLAQFQLNKKDSHDELVNLGKNHQASVNRLLEETSAIHHTLSLVSALLSLTRDDCQKPNLVAAKTITIDYIKTYLPELLDALRNGRDYKDRSLMQDLLLNLSMAVPEGGAWFGISRLISKEAWDKECSQAGFAQYIQRMYHLSGEGRKLDPSRTPVRRLYAIDSKEISDDLSKVIEFERGKGIAVKYDRLEDPIDISLIYQHYPNSESEILRPSLALKFEVNSTYDQLTKVSILKEGDAAGYAQTFIRLWNSASG
jgi:hypothetical protein